MSPRPLSLGAFQAALAARLDALGPEGLRALMERRAASLRPSEREAFLALFDPIDDNDDDGGGAPPEQIAALDRELVAFADAVAHLLPSRRWGWRERWDDDEDEPLPAEGQEAEDLLVAIGERFLAGEVTWAAGAYEQVFAVVQTTIDDDRDIDLGIDRALATEARNRLLWAIATTEPDAGAAGRRMVEAVELCDHATDALALDDIVAARPGAGPIAADVLRAFASALTADLRARRDRRVRPPLPTLPRLPWRAPRRPSGGGRSSDLIVPQGSPRHPCGIPLRLVHRRCRVRWRWDGRAQPA